MTKEKQVYDLFSNWRNFLTEKKKRPENVNIPILKRLERFSDDDNYFVSFTDLEKIGVNPNNRFSTPIGVYAYNLKDLWQDWVSGDRFFGDDRKYVNLIRLNTDRVLNLSSYANYSKDINFLKDVYEKSIKKKVGKNFEEFVEDVKQNADLYKYDNQASEIWGVSQAIAETDQSRVGQYTKRSTIIWNKILRDMGYDAVVDKGSNIHILQSSQAVFLVPSSYELIGRYMNRSYGQISKPVEYWGSDEQPFWRPGANPTVDIAVFKKFDDTLKILLIKRNTSSKAYPGFYALPGGFHDTNQPKGKQWKDDRESARQAAFRELTEETGLYIPSLNRSMIQVGKYEGNNRDPRDNEESWSRTTAFAVLLPEDINQKVAGRDDAEEAGWVSVEKALSTKLAFDHNQIIQDAIDKLGV
jgi:ADP-ribose pyrophosphatase YjhB (NUDIX family)